MAGDYLTNKEESLLEKRERNLALGFDPDELTPPFPKISLVELSNWCNHSCVFCTNPRMIRSKGFLDIEVYRQFIKESIPLGLEEVGLYTTGEPFFVKNLNEYVKIAKDGGAKYIYVTTNGALATPERVVPVIEAGLSSIKFSVNAGSRETYKLTHGKDDFDKVLANIKFISEYRKKHVPHLKMFTSSVLTKFTEGEKEKLREQLLPYVDDMVFYGVGIQGGQNLDQLPLLKSKMTDEPPAEGKALPCYMLWNRLHLTYEGFLNLCCIDYENALTYADLRKTSVKEAWHNQVIQQMRARHRDQKLENSLCYNCLYGKKGKVQPIAPIGHDSVDKVIESNDPKGSNDVLDRIRKLEEQMS